VAFSVCLKKRKRQHDNCAESGTRGVRTGIRDVGPGSRRVDLDLRLFDVCFFSSEPSALQAFKKLGLGQNQRQRRSRARRIAIVRCIGTGVNFRVLGRTEKRRVRTGR